MKILGIHDGHNCGASIIENGILTASISEERLSRSKNDVGYPKLSIDEVLKISNINSSELDSVVFASNFMHTKEHLLNLTSWYKVGLKDQERDNLKDKSYLKSVFDIRKLERIEEVKNHLNIDVEKIKFKEHHLCHAASAYFGSHFQTNEKILVLTADGAGDGLSATVNIAQGGKIKRISSTDRKASIGKIYSRITYYLGLKPWEHEYKIMGLAPYGDEKRALRHLDVFKNLIKLDEKDGISFELSSELETNYSYEYFRKELELSRFDEVSSAIQKFTEDFLVEWVSNCIKKTGIKKIALGGGVFMNVKANMKISQIKDLEDLYIFPSCGDESLSMGAAWLEHFEKNKMNFDTFNLMPNAYLGGEFSDEEIDIAIKENIDVKKCDVKKCDDIELEIAKNLADNNVVARFSGKMEWGARALGNRSILSNPKHWQNVEKINSMSKKRDFWMPFAPSMLDDKQDLYLINPKKLKSPYMMLGFDSKPIAKEHLNAALHPRDLTARAQLVNSKQSPNYYKLIKYFFDITGQGAVLNTSFNLHGYPLVYSPFDAIDVFNRSGLDCLAVGSFLISKK